MEGEITKGNGCVERNVDMSTAPSVTWWLDPSEDSV